MQYNFTGIILLLMLAACIIYAIVSWIILFHVKRYSPTKESAGGIVFAYLAGSAVFLGFMVLNGFALIELLR